MEYSFIQLIAETPTTHADPNSELKNRISFFDSILPDNTIYDLIATIVEYAFDLVGIISIAMIVYGGFIYITSGGDEQKVKQGQSIMTYAVIGLIIVLAALVIIRSVKSAIGA